MHFSLFRSTNMAQEVHIACERQRTVYPAWSIPWLPMAGDQRNHGISNLILTLLRWVSQMRALLAACRLPAGDQNRLQYVFEHKTQYIPVHAPHTHIVVFWNISSIPPMVSGVKFVMLPPMFYIAAIFVTDAVQPVVGCSDLWANIRCSGCSPLGGIFVK